MIPRRLLFVSLALALILALQPTPTTNSQMGALIESTVRTIILNAARGKIRISLPSDVAAGDTISGTVVAEPSGKDEREKQKNADELNGYVIEVNTKHWPVSGGVIQRFVIPPAITQPPLIILRDAKGNKISSAPLPVSSAPKTTTTPNFVIPQLGQSGNSISIIGPFDGDSSNTRVQIGGAPAKIIAESPRNMIIETPGTAVGPRNISVNDNGHQNTGNFRAVKIDLTAPKTSLLKGESTELHVEVQGLQGITQPVQLQIQNQTPANVNLTGGDTQMIPIQPSQVTTGGTFNWSTNITGISSGSFTITGTLPSGISGNSGNSTRATSPTERP